ncbi:hypothetical protein BOTBODRAFT_145444 [Botryobasidium botryosum FD-172 SS1]|uniref:Gfo/Idh/MocA-like oxidoreductase N-terminal domain-containing protein n=1 Tax=Botryobasidium botryosum (strain FD-172 SS1) TaxID=930990 RepID=A0A067MTM6_BOTB1|nr:hypothetical protein BOTBODRAFT_145444 [Botryobasidium botryosum FD-172 SS1]
MFPIATPSGLHFEWTMHALAAGKHVFLEELSSASADESRPMSKLAREKNLALLSVFYYSISRRKGLIHALRESKKLSTRSRQAKNMLGPWNPGPLHFLPHASQSWLTVHLEGENISTNNFIMPLPFHYIHITLKAKARIEKIFTLSKSAAGGWKLEGQDMVDGVPISVRGVCGSCQGPRAAEVAGEDSV